MKERVDPLNEALAQLIKKAVEGADKAGEFLVAEVPDVLGQLLTYYTVWYILVVVGAALGAGLLIKLMAYALKKHPDNDVVLIPTITLGGMGAAILAITSFANIPNMLKVWIAPKVWLLEYGASLVK